MELSWSFGSGRVGAELQPGGEATGSQWGHGDGDLGCGLEQGLGWVGARAATEAITCHS